jgi:hypothetical protein
MCVCVCEWMNRELSQSEAHEDLQPSCWTAQTEQEFLKLLTPDKGVKTKGYTNTVMTNISVTVSEVHLEDRTWNTFYTHI